MSFVFYDTETTGTHTAFDQILQFGAIRTDHELRELERFDIRCRLLPHVVPSPKALLTNGIDVQQLTDPALPSHYEMVRAIKAKLDAWSPAIFVGHNSMRFDEHLLRQALYQTLHPPYLTNTNNNGRLDSLPVFQAAHFLAPDVLTVPVSEKGRPTFSLERLAPANGFRHDTAHDAMGDTEATLYLCRLVHERAAGVWSNGVRFARKAAVLDYAQPGEVFAFVGFAYGRGYVRVVTAIGPNPERDSDLYIFDLSYDPHDLAALNGDDLRKLLAASPRPVRRLRANAAPCIVPYDDLPAAARVPLPGVEELESRAASIQEDVDLRERLMAAATGDRDERKPSLHVEEQIYDSFTGPADQALITAFHEAGWSERAALLGRLADPRLHILGERLLYSESPEVMNESQLSRYRADVARRLLAEEGTVPWLTLPQAMRETDELLAGLTGADAALLRGLRDYLVRRSEEARAIVR
ncbi:exonuclease domain-containing protein [Candidatus Entotheonella palauensis]|uniref:exonuclease domain-containing protein n=1 Tax=Candidatus Entotheonella palauensis TaxID=93172 RepID=UPI000B7E7C52|nr:exonuclease domain-containing protein [Candidatus Entotheonella palauensis]